METQNTIFNNRLISAYYYDQRDEIDLLIYNSV